MNLAIRQTPVVILTATLLVFNGCPNKKAAEDHTDQAALSSDDGGEPNVRPSTKTFGNFLSLEPAIAGLQSGMDTTAVQAILGLPKFVTTTPDIFDPGAFLLSWHYQNLIARFNSVSELGAVEITGRGISTSRGIAVGDSLSLVLTLYGKPARSDGVLYYFQDQSDIDNGDALIFRVQDGLVTSVYVGHLYE